MEHKPKKSLGQNFLKSIPALNKIVEAGEILPDDIILEIGPGKGVLTAKILEKLKTGKLIAVEKDKELFEFLKIKFEKEIVNKKLILINEDILSLDVSSNFSSLRLSRSTEWDPREAQNQKKHLGFEYKIIANIPYNITGAILKKFLTDEKQPERMVLMVQNEVAKRITAQDGKESILSISVKAYGKPKIIMKVPARYFSPAPKVDSAVISIKDISRKTFVENKIDEELFWNIIHAGFAHKRKKLSSNLKKYNPLLISLLAGGENTLKKSLGNKRPEELSLEEWIKITKSTLFSHKK